MILDRFLTKSLTTSGTSDQNPTGVIVDGGSAVDEFDLGLLTGGEPLWLVINITTAAGTSPTMTPSLKSDDNTSFSSATTIWTCPDELSATGLKVYKMPKVRERYVRFHTGSIGGSASPGFTFTAAITVHPPSGLL